MTRLWPLSLLVLSACQPHATSDVQPKAQAAAAASDFSQPISALGTEPFWAVSVSGSRLKLSRPGEPDLTAEAPGAAISAGQATWSARTEGGGSLVVTLRVGLCSDGMSDRDYPMTAEVTVDGLAALRGCAVKSADMPSSDGVRADR